MKHRSSLPALACVGGGILCVAIGAGVRPAGGDGASPSLRLTEAELSLIRGFDGGGTSGECSTMLTSMSRDCGWTIPPIDDCDSTKCDHCHDQCDWVDIIQTGGSSWISGQIVSRPCAQPPLNSKRREWPCDTTQDPCPCDTSKIPQIIDCPLSTYEVLVCAAP